MITRLEREELSNCMYNDNGDVIYKLILTWTKHACCYTYGII